MASRRTTELLATITADTNKIEAYLSEKGLSALSFEDNSQLEILKYPPEIASARRSLLEATRELGELAEGPQDRVLFGQSIIHAKAVVLQFIYHYKLYDLVPVDGRISFEDLAQETGLALPALTQLLRAATSFFLFRENPLGFISHTPSTLFIRQSSEVRDWVGFCYEESVPAFYRIVDALKRSPQADDPADSAYMLANNATEANLYEYLATQPGRSERFVGTMQAFHKEAGYAPHHICNNYPWAALGDGTVVDVGGSTGGLAFELAKVAPELNFVVQDLTSVIASAPPLPAGSKLSLMGHDFFTPQVVHGADVYILRWILHNWPDAFALKILRNLIPALKHGTKVLVIDEISPVSGSRPPMKERETRLMDLAMLSLLNARIRQLDEWSQLFATADSRFHLTRVIEPEGCFVAMMELTWRYNALAGE